MSNRMTMDNNSQDKPIQDIEGEVWKQIAQSRYEVSNYGRVKSLKRRKPRLLRQQDNGKGYQRVSLSLTKGQARYYLVSRLVAEAFIENDEPEVKNTVHHIDEDKKNNTVANLQWLSLADNVKEHFKKRSEDVNGKE